MNRSGSNTLHATIIAAFALAACDSGSTSPTPTSAKPAATTTASANATGDTTAAATAAAGDAAKLCADLGGKGAGTFSEPCKVPWTKQPPVAIKDVGIKKDFDKEVRMCELTNNSDRDLTWGSISSWYYDKSGKLLEVAPAGSTTKYKSYNHNGSTISIKKGEKREFACGWAKEAEPKDATIEVEMIGWGWGKDKEPDQLFVSRDTEGKTLDERPVGGFK